MQSADGISVVTSHPLSSAVRFPSRPIHGSSYARRCHIRCQQLRSRLDDVTSHRRNDTSKAFDSVEHGRLLEKLGWYGIDVEWFGAWLQGRTQCLRGGSSVRDVTHGVVHGSILGPVLFLVFTNDLTQHMPFGKIIMYADDAQFLDADFPLNT